MPIQAITIGDTVNYRPCFGISDPKYSVVRSMELTEHPRGKYGAPIRAAKRQQILENRVLFILDDGHWCYSEQIIMEGGNDE